MQINTKHMSLICLGKVCTPWHCYYRLCFLRSDKQWPDPFMNFMEHPVRDTCWHAKGEVTLPVSQANGILALTSTAVGLSGLGQDLKILSLRFYVWKWWEWDHRHKTACSTAYRALIMHQVQCTQAHTEQRWGAHKCSAHTPTLCTPHAHGQPSPQPLSSDRTHTPLWRGAVSEPRKPGQKGKETCARP